MTPYKGILFDMDGVIVDSMHHHAESWQNVFKSYYGIELTRENIFRREGMSGIMSIVDIFNEMGHEVPDEKEMVKLREKKLDIFEQKTINIFPESGEMLSLLSSKGIRMGLVTGSLMRSVRYVLRKEILNYFDVIVAVDDITNGKPHPEPYLKGVEALEIEKGNILAVENAPLGILSAKRAGIDCFAIETTLPRTYLHDADRVFENHEELYCFFRDNI